MKLLTKEQVIFLHESLVVRSGGSNKIRDENLLDSALNAPFQTFAGVELYPSLLEKASRLGYGLIQNHPFVDGNKRIGLHVMLVFLQLNGITVHYQDTEMIQFILATASGNCNDTQFLQWLQQHIQP